MIENQSPQDVSQRAYTCSLEFFPPKTEETRELFFETAEEALDMDLDFVSITYGAGGESRTFTREFAGWLNEHLPVPVMPHLTCVGHTREELRAIIRDFQTCGFESIMALRGDTPRGYSTFPVIEDGFRYASELVRFIRQEFPGLKIGVAGYPETHPEAVSFEADLENLERKLEAGANLVVTQLFFDNTDFYRFRDACRARGITAPLHAGILPPVNLEQLERFCGFCGSRIPEELQAQLEDAEPTRAARTAVGVEWTANQVEDLIRNGVDGLHFYMLNKPDSMRALKERLPWLRQKPELAARI